MKIPYRPDVDGLRAVAVLSVLGFHAFPEFFPGGYIGVDIFFVISGYLITSILAAELRQGQWSLAGFYARRILRIFPALFLVLLAVLLFGWHTLLAHEYSQVGKHVAMGAGFVANFAFWFEAGYFDRASELKPLLHLWSLGIEEQFYILWPLLLWGLWRLHAGGRAVFWRPQRSALLLGLASFVAAMALVFLDRTQAFYSPLPRAWELLAGAVLALRNGQGHDIFLRLRSGAWQAGALGLIVAGVLLLRPEYPFPGALALVPVAGAFVLVAADSAKGGFSQTLLSSRFMVRIGLISYPLYLWHWPLLSYARIIEGQEPSAYVRGLLLLLSLVLAALTFVLIEKPVRRLPRRWAIALLMLLLTLVGALGGNVYHRDGMERIRHKRIIQMDERLAADFVDFEKTGLIGEAGCDQPFRFPERDVCLVARPGAPVTAVVLGDSHAVHAFWGLAKAFEPLQINLKAVGKGACVPFLGYARPGDLDACQPHVDRTLQFIASSPDIRKVAIVFRGRYLKPDASEEAMQAFAAGLDATLGLLTRAGKQIYYFLPVVEPGFDPRLCVGSLPLGRKPPGSCVISQADDERKTAALRRVVARVVSKFPEVRIVNPNEAFCSDGQCPIVQQGHSLFKDDNHISHFGSLQSGQILNRHTESR